MEPSSPNSMTNFWATAMENNRSLPYIPSRQPVFYDELEEPVYRSLAMMPPLAASSWLTGGRSLKHDVKNPSTPSSKSNTLSSKAPLPVPSFLNRLHNFESDFAAAKLLDVLSQTFSSMDMDVVTKHDKFKIKATTVVRYQTISFQVQLYAKNSSTLIVEFTRRCGNAFHFEDVYRTSVEKLRAVGACVVQPKRCVDVKPETAAVDEPTCQMFASLLRHEHTETLIELSRSIAAWTEQPSNHARIVNCELLCELVNLLKSSEQEVLRNAVAVVANLCSAENNDVLVGRGVLSALCSILSKTTHKHVQRYCTKAVASFMRTHPERTVAEGLVDPLSSFSSSQDEEVSRWAREALSLVV
eukprot:GILJ01000380.1.p1 GENE.GILJ01000380.1~~GILJ01000380.1.p1  ORF type:complete len:357 (+),score=44.35 GILJ01000380.1:78-1148(+)